jgi:hypothetical protein
MDFEIGKCVLSGHKVKKIHHDIKQRHNPRAEAGQGKLYGKNKLTFVHITLLNA